jgi:two-component system sensor histidine kinase FlrB
MPWAKVVREVFSPKQSDYHEVSLRDGRLVSLDTSALDNSGQLIMMTDQTETRALQAKVSRHERLTAMGQMVASLAHQIRTPLSAAMLYASNLKSPKLSDDTRNQFADKLVNRLNHLEKQVQDMLLFVKGEVQLINRLSVTKLFDLLGEAISGLPEQQQVQVRFDIGAEDAHIQCQADALISAFMNIINNALEAQGETAAPIVVSSNPNGEFVEFVFIDQGPGMTPEDIQKVQEPFFTTKSYGTGLGIPVLIATVKAHRGQVSIVSEPGQGTAFHVQLPVFLER